MASNETADDEPRAAKCIRYNVPSNADKAEFDAEAGFALHTNGLVVFFDRIREDGREGRETYTFLKHDAEVAFLADDYDVSPKVAKKHAESHPGEKIRFADPK